MGTPVPPLPGGRGPAGAALLGWLADPLAPRLCVVTGSPDCGKSHLVAWLTGVCTAVDAPSDRRVNAMVPLRGLTVPSATWIIARQLDLYARTPAQLVGALAADSRPAVLVVGDLHRAGGRALPGEPQQVLDELLVPLLALPQLRVVVEADAATAAALLDAPSGDTVPPAVMDLDAPQWTDAERFVRWYTTLPGPVDRLAAEAAYPSPGLARLAAQLPPVDAAALTAPQLRDRWWAEAPEAARAALAALSTLDAPVTAEGWTRLVPAAHERRLVAELLPTAPSGAPMLSAALADHLRPTLPDGLPQQLCRTLAGTVPRHPDGRPDLDAVPEAHLTLLLAQALTAGQTRELLDDPDFLVRADPHLVTTAFKASGTTGPLAAAWAGAGPELTGEDDPGVRADILRHRLHGLSDGPSVSGRATGTGRRTLWRLAHGTAHWPGPVTALAAGRAEDGKPDGSLLAADAAGTVHRLALTDGSPLGRVPVSEPRPLRSLTDEGGGVLARLDVWGAPDPELPSAVPAVEEITALLRGAGLPDGVTLLGDGAGTVTWYDSRTDPTDSAAPGHRSLLHSGPVSALAVAHTPTLPPLVLSGGADGTVRLWSPGADPLPEPLAARPCPVLALSVAPAADGPAAGALTIAVSWADGLIHLHRPGSGLPPHDLRLGPPVQDLLLLPGGRLAVATAEEVSVIEFNDPSTPTHAAGG